MFGEIYQKIGDELRRVFPKIPVYDAYPETKKIEKVPAIFFEMTDFEPEGDPMTGEMDFETRWEALAVLPPARGRQQVTARDVAARIALAIHNQTFVDYARQARVIRCVDSRFDLAVAGYEVWSCEWAQLVRLGVNDWDTLAMYPEAAEVPP
jgi:hypothetical protein